MPPSRLIIVAELASPLRASVSPVLSSGDVVPGDGVWLSFSVAALNWPESRTLPAGVSAAAPPMRPG
jgi:hypothetical protein